MPLNRACLGKIYPPITTEVTLDAMQKYARACNDDNPRYFDAASARRDRRAADVRRGRHLALRSSPR